MLPATPQQPSSISLAPTPYGEDHSVISPGSELICLPRLSPGTDLVHPCPSPGSGNRGCWSQTSLSNDLTRIDLGLPDPCKGVASRPLNAHPSAGVQDFCKAGFIWLLSSAQGLCPHPPLRGVSPSALHPLRRLGGPLLDPCPAPPPPPGFSPQAHSSTSFAACTVCPPL